MFDAGAVVVEPDVGGGLSFGEEEDVGFDALGVENASGESEDGVEVEVAEETFSDVFASSAFE